MLEFLKDAVIGFSLLAFAALTLGPVMWRAGRALARQGILFALIGCGFLVSMASKPSPKPTPEPTTYTIAYENARGAANPNPTSYTVEDEIVFAALADVEGHTFVGWTPDGIAKGTVGNLTVTAQWEETPPVVPDEPDQPDEPDKPDAPDEPDTPDTPDEPDAPDVPVEPVPETNLVYAITYQDLKGAINANPTSYTVEDEIVFSALADVEGFAFKGWSPVGIVKGTVGDVVVTATWEAIVPDVPDEPVVPDEPAVPDVPDDPIVPDEPKNDFIELETNVAMVPLALDLEGLFGEEATKAKSVSVKGLPSGLAYKDGVVAGTPKKSGVSVATVTLTTAADAKSVVALTFVVRMAGEHFVVASCDAAEGKVSGQGVYARGKKVTLKATANKGYVFAGWRAAERGILPTYSFTMPGEDVALGVAFVTDDEDRAAIAASVDGMLLSGNGRATNVMAGVSVEWPVVAEALSDTTVKVSGLPSGLKFTAKDIYVKGSKTEIDVPANTIYGTPTAATKSGKPSAVKVTVTTAGKTKREFVLSLTVADLPSWAVGTFNGGSDAGQLSLTVANTGKMSGKWLTDGKTWALSATGYDSHLDESAGTHETLFASLRAKCGKETREILIGVTPYGLTGYDGTGILFVADAFDWKSGELKTLAAKIAKAPALDCDVDGEQPGTVTLKFGANGTAKVSSQFQVGEKGGEPCLRESLRFGGALSA